MIFLFSMLAFCLTLLAMEAILNVVRVHWFLSDKLNEKGHREVDQMKVFVVGAVVGVLAGLVAAFRAEEMSHKYRI